VSGTGRFCGECGRALIPADAAPAQILRHEAREVLGLDARIAATARDLLLHPLRITKAWIAADRTRYVPATKVLLTLGAIYMLALSLLTPYSFDPRDLTAAGFDPRTAAQIAEMVRESGVPAELVAERFQSRMNTLAPIIILLAVFPMVGVLKLLRRQDAWYKHFAFVVGISNAVWVAALLLLPVAVWNQRVHAPVVLLVTYAYLAAGYFAFYRERTSHKTIGKFLIFAIADFIITTAVQLPLMWVVFLSAQRF
jgi:hypothetical protein